MNVQKTALGQAEIERRQLGLSLLARRLLILVDGQRDPQALHALMGGRDIDGLLRELEEKGCVQRGPQGAPQSIEAATDLRGEALPPRSLAQIDMGRHFIVNTLSTFTGPYAHADLMSEAMKAAGQEELRGLLNRWRAALEVEVPAKRLAQLEADLLKVI